MSLLVIESPNGGRFAVEQPVIETGAYRGYLCNQHGNKQERMLLIATDITHNGDLDRMAFALRQMKEWSDQVEAAFAKAKTDPEAFMNYDLTFPELVESFISEDQGDRRVVVIAFRNVDKLSNLVPINCIIERDQLRADLRSAAWVMGKFLKALVFTHGQNFAINDIQGDNMLLETAQHYVVFYDLSHATYHAGKMPDSIKREEIANVAQTVIALAGGDAEKGSFPTDDEGERLKPLKDYLLELAQGTERDAKRAHTRWYEIIDGLWPREFYPFTTYSL